MSIEAGHTTYWQAKRGVTQIGLVFSLDAAVDASYTSGTTWYDLSGNGNNGTLTNGPIFNRANGGSIEFDGTNDHVDTNYTTAIGYSRFTFEAWVTYTDFQQGSIIAKRTNVSSYEQLNLFVAHTITGGDDGPQICSYERSSAGIRKLISTGWYHVASGNGVWHHVVLVRDTSQNKLYVDGTLETTSTDFDNTGVYTHADTLGNIPETPPITVGCAADGASPYTGRKSFFDGNIAIAKAYNRALTGTEILKNYNELKGDLHNGSRYSNNSR